MPLTRNKVKTECFNPEPLLPHNLRIEDFQVAMQDVYDFFHDVNRLMDDKGLPRLEEALRGAIMSGTVSDMLTVSMAKHSRSLVKNAYHNGHPDLLIHGRYANNKAKQAGDDGVEIKSTKKMGAAVDHHGARAQWLCVFVYEVDVTTEPAIDRRSMRFVEVYLGRVTVDDFRKNPRKTEIGTRTATLNEEGLIRFRKGWIYRDITPRPRREPRASAPPAVRAQKTSR